MIIDDNIKKLIEDKIDEIEKEYQRIQGLILTEDDLQCLLYNKLIQISELSAPKRAKEHTAGHREVYATSIHSEITWYDQDNKLKIRPDITILEPENLNILQKGEYKIKLPSKEYSFSGDAIIFELKFVRNKTGITRVTLNTIKEDYEKIQKIFKRLRDLKASNEIFCYFVIFNKTDIKCREFSDFLEQNRLSKSHKIIYATGNVDFSNRRQK